MTVKTDACMPDIEFTHQVVPNPPPATPSQSRAEDEQALLQRAFAILDRRYASGEGITSPAAAADLFKGRLGGCEQEVFAVLFLDNHHRVLAYEEMFFGTIDGAEVHPREVVKRALALNAAAVILGHGHPSGSPEPSAADRAVTAQLKQALALVDVRLLDHFVVGNGPPVSLAMRGWV